MPIDDINTCALIINVHIEEPQGVLRFVVVRKLHFEINCA
jgi:hypothetical protein